VAQQLTEPLTEHTHAGTGSSDMSAIPIEDLDDGVGVQHLATVGSFAMMSMAPSEAPIRDPTVPMALSPLLPSLAPDANAPAPLAFVSSARPLSASAVAIFGCEIGSAAAAGARGIQGRAGSSSRSKTI
jgi:hypothetical protein